MSSLWLIFIGTVLFTIGFGLGRKVGMREGYKRGLEEAPLELKRRSLELGECLICGITKNFQDYAGKH